MTRRFQIEIKEPTAANVHRLFRVYDSVTGEVKCAWSPDLRRMQKHCRLMNQEFWVVSYLRVAGIRVWNPDCT